MNARRRHLRAAACLTLVGLLACLPLAAAFGSVDEDDMALRLSAAERALPPDRLPDFDASCAALMDEDGTLWFGRNADDAAQIASLTKIMTAIVAADWLDASTMIEVTPEVASVGESSAGLAQGDSMTFDDALKALLTASGNDAASAIAQAAGARMLAQKGSGGDAYACEAAFVEAMNAKAAELGLENSFFANPHGLDFDAFAQGQYSCAADVATMLRAAMQIDLVRANIGFSQADITVQRDGAPYCYYEGETIYSLQMAYEHARTLQRVDGLMGWIESAFPSVAAEGSITPAGGDSAFSSTIAPSMTPQLGNDDEQDDPSSRLARLAPEDPAMGTYVVRPGDVIGVARRSSDPAPDIVLPSIRTFKYVSQRHGTFTCAGGTWSYEQHDVNGTKVRHLDGSVQKLAAGSKVELVSGDELSFAESAWMKFMV